MSVTTLRKYFAGHSGGNKKKTLCVCACARAQPHISQTSHTWCVCVRRLCSDMLIYSSLLIWIDLAGHRSLFSPEWRGSGVGGGVGSGCHILLATSSNSLPSLVRNPAAFRSDMTFGKSFLKRTYAARVLHRAT